MDEFDNDYHYEFVMNEFVMRYPCYYIGGDPVVITRINEPEDFEVNESGDLSDLL